MAHKHFRRLLDTIYSLACKMVHVIVENFWEVQQHIAAHKVKDSLYLAELFNFANLSD